jgi:hypothetical protein
VLYCYVTWLLSCFDDMLLELRDSKHFLLALLNLLVDSFEILDLLVEIICGRGFMTFLLWFHVWRRSSS